jgi:transposase InsO family protein
VRSTPRESPLDKQKGVQGFTFTAEAFTSKLVTACVVISMDGRGRFMGNIFIERLWRSIKYEELHLKAYADGCEARSGISSWMNFYNFRHPHQAMNNQMPMAVVARRHGQNRGGGEGCGYAASLGQRKRVPT